MIKLMGIAHVWVKVNKHINVCSTDECSPSVYVIIGLGKKELDKRNTSILENHLGIQSYNFPVINFTIFF